MKKVSSPQVVTTADASELPLPAEIQAALGELVGAATEGRSRPLALAIDLAALSQDHATDPSAALGGPPHRPTSESFG
jgi:hypothetical protein